ncbi:MAG: enoyl-CoA hydratase/isomerase family protein [Alicyclobacillus sp.]|nr:enoyl-CoA hydratase/isomerase family protein [Alicyclobacillus sp.]
MYENIECNIMDNIAILKINRPEVSNAINVQTGHELYDALKRLETQKQVRAIVLTGSGRAFCSGQDLKERNNTIGVVRLGDSVRERYNLLISKIHSMQVPIIAAINGVAAGAGFGLALACDLRFAATDAKFMMAFSKIGLAPDSGTSYFLPRLVGIGRALEWAWTAEIISAETAYQYGVVNRLFEPDVLLDETVDFAMKLAAGPTKSFALTKQAMYSNLSESLANALEREALLQDIAGSTHDFREGILAFIEKRKPKYQGE